MRKIIYCLMAVLIGAAASPVFAQEYLPKWAQEIWDKNPDIIDSILYYVPDKAGPDTRTYVIYYHQPLNHSQPGSALFPLRALITVFKDNDPTMAVNHVYASGYNIAEVYGPDSAFLADKNDCTTEIAWRYHANYIQIEHRYFQYSAPSECWTRLDDLRAEEAAADFHNLFVALKKVLKGKYVMSGVSKGGITTLLQHKFYPEDMDIYVPYSAPFFNTDRDLEMQKYWYNTGWNKEYRDMFMTIRKEGINNSDNIYPIYAKMYGGAKTQGRRDSLYCHYMLSIAAFGNNEHAYSDTASLRRQLYQNDSIMKEKGVPPYGDTVYAYMLYQTKFSLMEFPQWLDTLRKYPDPEQAPKRTLRHNVLRPFGITAQEWWLDTIQGEAYEYQSKCELGFYDYRFDMIIDNPTTAQTFNNYWVQHAGCVRDLSNPYYRSLTFNPALYNETMAATQNATKPIVLIYGEDDNWTGAAVKDEFVNGTNVRKFILPAQNHLVSFTSDADKAQCDAIRDILDAVIFAPEGLEPTPFPSGEGRGRLVLRDGLLLIEKNGRTYNMQGAEVR